MLLENLILVELDSMNDVHKKEVELIEELYNSILEKDIDAITPKLDAVITDIKDHFSSEEQKMQKYKFPAFLKHKMAHARVLMEVASVQKDWQQNKNPAILQDYFENTFHPWITRHLQTMDSVTAAFLKEAGAE